MSQLGHGETNSAQSFLVCTASVSGIHWRPQTLPRCAIQTSRRHCDCTSVIAPHGPATNLISAAAVRANQLPRVVSCAEALLPSMVIVNIPSRLRSATVIPETGLSSAPAASEPHTPYRLCRVPPPFKQAMRAVRLAGERIAVGAGCSLDAWAIAAARFSRGSSAISPAFPHSPATRDRVHNLADVLRSFSP
jgi:hypothetical protein